MLKLFQIEFDATHPDEFNHCTIIQAKKKPSVKLCEELIAMMGTVYVNDIKEVSEADIRYIEPKRVIYLDR